MLLLHHSGGSSSVGRASASQAEGRGSESRFPLNENQPLTTLKLVGGFLFAYNLHTTNSPSLPLWPESLLPISLGFSFLEAAFILFSIAIHARRNLKIRFILHASID